MINILKIELDKMNGMFNNTSTDLIQFERNVRIDYKSNIIIGHLKLLTIHKGYIGKKVYKYLNNFKFSDDLNQQDSLNKLNPVKVEFSVVDYAKLEKDLATFMVDRLTRELTEGSITNNSTNKFQNLKFEWILESKQELISLYKNFI